MIQQEENKREGSSDSEEETNSIEEDPYDNTSK
jgi:hypothetical protein